MMLLVKKDQSFIFELNIVDILALKPEKKSW